MMVFRVQSLFRQASRSTPTFFSARRTTPSTRILPTIQSIRTVFTKRFTAEHEAVVFDDQTGMGVVSITDHAQSSLGDVVFVELPSIGTEVLQGDQIGAVESVKAASDIYAPVSGTIQEVNEALNSEPGLMNKSPEDKGWLCKIKLSDPSEMDKLMTETAYKASYEH